MKRAALVLATSVALLLSGVSVSTAATRVNTGEPPFTDIMNAAQGAIGLPYGDPAYFGREFTSEHSAGSRFTAGSITGQLPPGTPSKVAVKIKPVITINPAKVAAAVKTAVKGGNVPGIVASAAVAWAIDQIPGASVTPEGTLLRTPQGLVPTSGPSFDYYMTPELPGIRYDTPKNLCIAAAEAKGNIPDGQGGGLSGGTCYYKKPDEPWTSWSGAKYTRYVEQCPSMLRTASMYCSTGAPQPFTDTDYDALQDAIENVTNSDWLRDLTRAKCEGSLSPEACYQDLVQRRPQHGPASQDGPKVSSTTKTTNPDGTTSSTTTTTQNNYTYNYNQNSYDYTVTRTTTVTKDGKTTTEVTTEDPMAPGDTPPEESQEEDQEPMPDISDAYKPYIDKLNDIKTDVAAPPAVVSPIGWSAWYSFGGGCSEITAELPVIGSWSTSYCPYIYDWVRPILAFMFVVFTWHYCRELWSEAVTQARPM